MEITLQTSLQVLLDSSFSPFHHTLFVCHLPYLTLATTIRIFTTSILLFSPQSSDTYFPLSEMATSLHQAEQSEKWSSTQYSRQLELLLEISQQYTTIQYIDCCWHQFQLHCQSFACSYSVYVLQYQDSFFCRT